MNKIAVIGCCGGGKTVLAKRISRALEIPVFHLDDLFWHEGWVMTKPQQWQEINSELVKKDRWIIDGTYSSTLQMRIRNADTIIFIDLPLYLCFYRVLKRQIRNYFGWEKSLPSRIQKSQKYSKQRIISDWSFYSYVLSFKKNFHPLINRLISDLNEDQRLIKLDSAKQVTAFLENLTVKS